MKKYRLKKEAVPFFKEKHATKIYTKEVWDTLSVDEKALEVVEEAYLSFGHETSKSGSSLGGWSEKEGAKFSFTINFPSVKLQEYDKFSNGKVTRELMGRIQNVINSFYYDYSNGDAGDHLEY